MSLITGAQSKELPRVFWSLAPTDKATDARKIGVMTSGAVVQVNLPEGLVAETSFVAYQGTDGDGFHRFMGFVKRIFKEGE